MLHLRKFNENKSDIIRKVKGYWNFEKVKEDALRFNSRSEFQIKSKSAYTIAYKNDWLDDVCSHMPKPYIWTFDKVKEEALKFNTRSDFKNSSLAYSVATRRGWLDEVCSHMEPQGSKYKRHIYKALFTDNSIYIGLTYNLNKRIGEHLTNKKSSIYKHIIETGLRPEFSLITNQLLDNGEASKMECKMISHYMNLGFNILNRVKGGGLGGCIIIWTFDKVKEEALKFKTRGDFQKKSRSAYSVARNNNWLDTMCSHMTKIRNDKGYWTIDKVREDALKFGTKSNFKIGSMNAYSAAKRNGWLDDVCSHMTGKMPNGYWTIDKVREEALKFKTRSEFKRESSSAYSYALKNGWLDDVSSHMKKN
jgi:predicted GIY-YIG superfamily endonuclease/isopentenyldiphosphate isomerase